MPRFATVGPISSAVRASDCSLSTSSIIARSFVRIRDRAFWKKFSFIFLIYYSFCWFILYASSPVVMGSRGKKEKKSFSFFLGRGECAVERELLERGGIF